MPPKKDQDSKYGSRLLRMFLKLMVDGKKHIVPDLESEFCCSRNTVVRMAECIEDVLGDQLESGRINRKKYYQIRSCFNRRSLGLDFDEIRYLSLCKELAAGVLPKDRLEKIEHTIFNLSCLMSDPDYSRRKDAQHLPVRFNPKGYIDYAPHHESIDKLLMAAREKRVCMVEYKASGETECSARFFAPGRITFMSSALYVEGYKVPSGGSEQGRPTTFAIHRIADVTVTERTFDFDAADREIGAFGLKHHDVKYFRIKFDKGASEYVRERIWSTDQKLEEQEDGTVVLEVGTVSEKELMAWVRSFGEQAELLS
ncbi:WYL domain-containing protein [uncultured Pseudodesulfovibrio sp.]|uniref:helix-turn-helix transcriptional regulator n=1 Tax=uncultured Pseudodesulfovibrio sp. TaxID=2035858 RepID=UPI0029C96C12|nr:WYL domain-containing protein [uncultured Pseudodesulfovibrio sp.]